MAGDLRSTNAVRNSIISLAFSFTLSFHWNGWPFFVPRLTAQKNANNVPKLVADITLTLSHHKRTGKLKGRVCADNKSQKFKRLVKNNRLKNWYFRPWLCHETSDFLSLYIPLSKNIVIFIKRFKAMKCCPLFLFEFSINNEIKNYKNTPVHYKVWASHHFKAAYENALLKSRFKWLLGWYA